jgi:hypothetical protein
MVNHGPLLRTRWRSTNLRLVMAVQSLPAAPGPWPEVDEEAWWSDILNDRRLRPSLRKRLSERDDARLRLDRLPCKSLTFACTAPQATGDVQYRRADENLCWN